MNKEKVKQAKKLRRSARTRATIFGTSKRPRLSVHRSLNHISAQLIDDQAGKTLVAAGDIEITRLRPSRDFGGQAKSPAKDTAGRQKTEKDKGTKIKLASEVGKLMAKKAVEKKITTCIFDKGSYKYHGRVKALADGAREAGLKF